MLTRDNLREYLPGSIFAMGAGHFPSVCSQPIQWIAVRGGVDDWAIYYQEKESVTFNDEEIEHLRKHGDKVYNKQAIREMVNPDADAMVRYRL